jgi:hypothetical protein
MVVHNIGELTVFIPGHRPESIRFKKPVNLTRPRDDIAVPEEILAPTCTFLEYPPPEGIVCVAPPPLRAISDNKLILRVPLVCPALRAEPLARHGSPYIPTASVMLQRHDLAARAVGDADDACRSRLPVQESVGLGIRRCDVQVGRIGKTLGATIAILRAGGVPLLRPMRRPTWIVKFVKKNLPNI